jgi:two-component system cell cycle response regulator DivK
MATILVVDDNRTSLKLATLLLEKAGHTVLQAEDGASALVTTRDTQPDLILMDVQMPGMDGLTVTGILKREPATAAIPVVALTAFAMRGDEEKILAAGCNDYIAKPFQHADFLAKVEKNLKEKSS